MNNKHWSLALLLTMGVLSASAEETPSVVLGQSQNNTTVYFQTSDTSAVADHYTAEQLAAYRGATITSVSVDMNASTDHLRVFVASSLTGQTLAEKTVASTGEGWKTVAFDQPYTITGDPIYIGYEMVGVKSLRYGKALIEGEQWFRRRSGAWEQYEGSYRFSFYATVTGADVPVSNAAITLSTLPVYAVTGQTLALSGTLANLGNEAITSATFRVLVDGEAVATQTVSNLNIRKRRAGSFALNAGTISTDGYHTLAVEVTHVNGVADTDLYLNSSKTVRVLSAESLTPRQTLMEVFSTEPCTGCPTGHEYIEKAVSTLSDVIEVDHHAGYLKDGLTIDASKSYEWFFGTNVYAPAVMFDRKAFIDDLPTTFYQGVPPVQPTSAELVSNLHTLAVATPALASVDLQTAYDRATRRLTVSVSGEQLLPFDDMDNICLNVYLTEDSIYSTTQAASGGSFWHRHSLRRVLTSTWGDSYDPGTTGTVTYETTLDEAWDDSHMAVVAFLANYDSSEKTNCCVLQAASQPVVKDATAIHAATTASSATVVSRLNAAGQVIDQPATGLNILRMSDGTTRKVLVK